MAKRITLKSPQDVRRALARVANMLLNKEIDPKTANAIIYACNSILQSVRVDEQERKIEELANLVDQLAED